MVRAMAEHTVTVSDGKFKAEVLDSQQPVLVDFWATWCAPCIAMEPALEELAVKYAGKAKVAKLNIEDNQLTPAAVGHSQRAEPHALQGRQGGGADCERRLEGEARGAAPQGDVAPARRRGPTARRRRPVDESETGQARLMRLLVCLVFLASASARPRARDARLELAAALARLLATGRWDATPTGFRIITLSHLADGCAAQGVAHPVRKKEALACVDRALALADRTRPASSLDAVGDGLWLSHYALVLGARD